MRMDAFALLTDSLKTTERLTAVDLDLIRCFLIYNLNNQQAAVRQQLVGHMKKVSDEG